MAEQEDTDLEGLEAPVDLDDDDLVDLDDDDLADDTALVDPLVDDPLVDDPLVDEGLGAPLVDDALNAAVPLAVETVESTGEPAAVPVTSTDDDDDDDDDDDLDPDDVEAGLDVILKDRLVVVDEEVDEDEEAPDPDERAEGSTRVPTKRPEEFVCASCFLVKHPGQLADPDRLLCRDCV